MSLAESLLADLDSDLEFDNADTPDAARILTPDDLFTVADLHEITDIADYIPILPEIDALSKTLDRIDDNNITVDKLSNAEDAVLTDATKLITQINTTFQLLLTFIKLNYSKTWPDLEMIVKNPLFYIRIIQMIKFELLNFKKMVEDDTDESLSFLPKDQILSLTMSINFLLKSNNQQIPDDYVQKLIIQACEISDSMNQTQLKFRNFITNRVKIIAPNITALVGPNISSQLISAVGLRTLSITPACNILSIGKNVTSNTGGYISQCDLVKNVPDDFKKNAIRQLSAKLVMAARVDSSNNDTRTDGSVDDALGQKWKNEIQSKLEKMILPPENTKIKPLPKPIDMKSKKRGGRKFKKMRERMKMSEMEKAQNKMAFGEEEVTKYDSFGNAIGLGMLGRTSVNTVRRSNVSKATQKQLSDFNKIA